MQYHEEISAIHAGHLTKFFQPRKISLPDNLYSIQQPLSTSRVPNTFQTLRTANIAAQRRSSVEICAPSPTVQSLIHTDLSQRHMRKFIRLTGIHNTVPYLHDRSRPASVYGPTRLEQRHRSVTDILRLTTILPATTLMPDFIQRSIQPRRIYPHRSIVIETTTRTRSVLSASVGTLLAWQRVSAPKLQPTDADVRWKNLPRYRLSDSNIAAFTLRVQLWMISTLECRSFAPLLNIVWRAMNYLLVERRHLLYIDTFWYQEPDEIEILTRSRETNYSSSFVFHVIIMNTDKWKYPLAIRFSVTS